MDPLAQFYGNETQKKAVYDFLVEQLKEQALENVFARGETQHFADAKDSIDRAFNRLQEIYGKIPIPVINSSR